MTRADRAAAWIVAHIIGTVGFVWFCLMLALFPLLVPRAMTAVQFISSGVLQLVLLPVLLIGQQQAEARRSEIEAQSQGRHEAREKRAARHQEQLLERIEQLCERIVKAEETV